MDRDNDRPEPPDDDLMALFRRTAPEATPTDVEALFARAEMDRRPWQRPLSRRLSMTIRMSVGALAAAGLAAALSVLVPRETSAAFGLVEVERQVATARTVTYTTTLSLNNNPPQSMKTLRSGSHLIRTEYDGGYTVIDLKAKRSMIIRNFERSVEFQSLTNSKSGPFDFHQKFKEIAQDPTEVLPGREVDGKPAIGFVANWHGYEVTVWVDPDSRRPVRVEETRKFDKNVSEVVTKDIVFDRPLDESLFRMIPPEGFKEGRMTPIQITSNVAPLAPLPADRALAAPEVIPLVGIGPARFGMTKDEVIKALGKPDREFAQGKSTYLFYDSRGFELSIAPAGRPAPGLNHVSCVRTANDPFHEFRAFQGKTDKGLGLGATRAEILKAYGSPDPDPKPDPQEANTGAAASSGIATDLVYRKLGLTFTLIKDQTIQITVAIPRPAPTANE